MCHKQMGPTWRDARAGAEARSVGDLVLHHLADRLGGEFVHQKGTIFATKKMVVVGRLCNAAYLGRRALHFSNLSRQQHEDVKRLAKDRTVCYLLITVNGRQVTYWLIPYDVMSHVIQKATIKKCDDSSFVRVLTSVDGETINGVEVTNYRCDLTRPEQDELAVCMVLDGHRYEGMLKRLS